ncbi:MAG: HTH domain-containing protein [Caldilineaceae bacterium]
MRADRLLSILMLLQSRGQLSARELAAELAVSERTIYRDIDALSASGVPVYAETGRDGGYGLLDSYRTSLTGLTDGEVRALFMLSVPGPLTQLGVSQELVGRAAQARSRAAQIAPPGRRMGAAALSPGCYLVASAGDACPLFAGCTPGGVDGSQAAHCTQAGGGDD